MFNEDPSRPTFDSENTVLGAIQRGVWNGVSRALTEPLRSEHIDLWNEASAKVTQALSEHGFPTDMFKAEAKAIDWGKFLPKNVSMGQYAGVGRLVAYAETVGARVVVDRWRYLRRKKRTPDRPLISMDATLASVPVSDDAGTRDYGANSVAQSMCEAVCDALRAKSDDTALIVLDGMQRGHTDKEISLRTDISTSTVHNAHRRIDKAFVIAGIHHLGDLPSLHQGLTNLRLTPEEAGIFLREIQAASSPNQLPVYVEYTLVGMAAAIRMKLCNTKSDDDCARFASSVGEVVAHVLDEYGTASPVLRLIRELRLMVSTEDEPILQVRRDNIVAIVQGQLERHKGKPSSDHEAPRVEVPYDA